MKTLGIQLVLLLLLSQGALAETEHGTGEAAQSEQEGPEAEEKRLEEAIENPETPVDEIIPDLTKLLKDLPEEQSEEIIKKVKNGNLTSADIERLKVPKEVKAAILSANQRLRDEEIAKGNSKGGGPSTATPDVAVPTTATTPASTPTTVLTMGTKATPFNEPEKTRPSQSVGSNAPPSILAPIDQAREVARPATINPLPSSVNANPISPAMPVLAGTPSFSDSFFTKTEEPVAAKTEVAPPFVAKPSAARPIEPVAITGPAVVSTPVEEASNPPILASAIQPIGDLMARFGVNTTGTAVEAASTSAPSFSANAELSAISPGPIAREVAMETPTIPIVSATATSKSVSDLTRMMGEVQKETSGASELALGLVAPAKTAVTMSVGELTTADPAASLGVIYEPSSPRAQNPKAKLGLVAQKKKGRALASPPKLRPKW